MLGHRGPWLRQLTGSPSHSNGAAGPRPQCRCAPATGSSLLLPTPGGLAFRAGDISTRVQVAVAAKAGVDIATGILAEPGDLPLLRHFGRGAGVRIRRKAARRGRPTCCGRDDAGLLQVSDPSTLVGSVGGAADIS
ncbi:hypothetical protein ACH5A3_40415 [Streptomyces echinatus]|uniref:hypothetical protein n=1 Tax=Streptomyces echinatus TaxID=67293 RepID=UPI003787D91A